MFLRGESSDEATAFDQCAAYWLLWAAFKLTDSRRASRDSAGAWAVRLINSRNCSVLEAVDDAEKALARTRRHEETRAIDSCHPP